MKRKGIFTILAALFMVLAFSAMALAANNVRLTTTVPNIPKSTCYQAGTDTLEFDHLTAIAEGDVTQFTLNNKVTVCKAIDMFVTVAAPGAGVLETAAAAPVATTGGAVNALGGTAQWGFLVQAATGSQLIRVTLRVRSATGLLDPIVGARVMTFTGTAATDRLLLKLFDGKFGSVTSLIYTPVAAAYNTLLTPLTGPTTNILCIDTLTQDYMDEYVQNTPDSIPVKFVNKLFYSGDYRIAHIMAAQTFNLLTCKGATCGHIWLGVGGQNVNCTAFEYETFGSATGANGYCADHKADAGYLPKLIIQTSQPFDLVSYIVSAEILVNGVAGEHGVYWSNVAPLYKTSATTTCGTAVGAIPFAGVAYLRGDGVTVPVPVAPIVANCAGVAAAAKAVKFTTTAGPLFIAGDYFFELNLPAFNYNLAEVNAGDLVEVRVTLTKGTCGTQTFTLCIGTFGCVVVPPGPAPGAMRLCPYVTSLAAGDAFWNGIAIANEGAVAGDVTITAYKNDNTTATATVNVPANGMVVSLVSDFTWTGTTPAGVPAYLTLQAAAGTIAGGNMDAFVMMADGATNSMGYLCK